MSIWPFRRKSKRKNAGAFVGAKRAATEPITVMQRSGSRRSIGSARRNGSQTELPGLSRKRTGRLKNRKQSADGGNKLVRDPERRKYSFSPGRKESLAIAKDIHHQYPVPPIPADAANMPGKTGTINPRTGARIYPSTTNDSIDRAPTLHKRSAVDLNHRKSSKKRKEDRERLSELKAMTKSMPPPPSRSTTTLDPFRTDTIKSRGVKRIFPNYALNMSLPHHESMHSSNSSDVEGHTSYILKGIDLFSPRPTIRYAEHPRHKYKSTPNVERAPVMSSRADEFDQEKSRKRIEELADELNAHDLHELMDRDRRRRERKKQHDLEKAERRLARRAAKQAAAEKEAETTLVGQAVDDLDRRALARESGALGIHTPIEDRPPLVPRRSSRRNSGRNSRRDSTASSTYSQELTEKLQDFQDDQLASAQSPTSGFIRSDSLPGTEPTSPYDERDEVIIQTAQIARLSRANMSPPASPARHFHDHKRGHSNVFQMKDLPPAPILLNTTPLHTPPPPMVSKREDMPPSEEQKAESAYRRSSETGSSFQHSSWKSWFKRTSKDRRSSTQSSFSNTTRESIIASQQSNSQATAPPPVAYAMPVGQNSGIPKRTMSRFREDLPELPISPPASRVQSPEAIPIPGARNLDPHRAHIGRELSDTPFGLRRYDSPNSFNRQAEQGSLLRYETPNVDCDAPSPEPVNHMSQSLASIDSEGSWLSGGRPRADSKRSSAQRSSARSSRQQGDYNQNPSRHSHGSIQARRYKDFPDHLDGGDDIAEDEYYSRLTPDMYNRVAHTEASRISGNPMPSSDEEDNERMRTPISTGVAGNEGKWGNVSRKPTIIRHVQRTHSAQGVLNNYDDASSDDDDRRVTQGDLDDRWKAQEREHRPRTPESPMKEDGDSQLDASPGPEVLERATSIDYRKNHIRHISAGSARLLDLKPRMSGEHAAKRKSVGF